VVFYRLPEYDIVQEMYKGENQEVSDWQYLGPWIQRTKDGLPFYTIISCIYEQGLLNFEVTSEKILTVCLYTQVVSDQTKVA